jgi:hypothetical protein
VFCLFAEDVGLLPERLFTKVVENTQPNPEQFKDVTGKLFTAMARGGHFGAERIAHFNGDLFDDSDVLDVTGDEIRLLREVTGLDWSAIDASIFGTLFERALDPDKRSQLGAHYTSREDIEALIEPVVMDPLRREWAAVRAEAETLVNMPVFTKQRRDQTSQVLRAFLNRLQTVTVLDPACGSGNFLFVTLQKLKDLEKEVIVFAARHVGGLFPGVHPGQLRALEINKYAHELAQMTVWIGYLQWVKRNGLGDPEEPILQRLTTFENKDAVLALEGGATTEPGWPDAEFIVGNPPFLGGKRLRDSLGDEYVNALYSHWSSRVPSESDYCCYWFEKARAQIQAGRSRRAGLIATQAIRGGASRETLKRIKASGDIFFGISDRDWVLDGAAVHVSMVGFDDGTQKTRVLDGQHVEAIHANLTASLDITQARRLKANRGMAFMGDTKGGSFELPEADALALLDLPNPNGKPNSDVLVPWSNGKLLTRDRRRFWIVDFGESMSVEEAALYERPFEVASRVKAERQSSKTTIAQWWKHERPRVEMRRALRGARRYLVTPRVGVHRLFIWVTAPLLPDSATFAFASADDYMMGVLQSRIHEVWARSQATQVRERESGTRYTPRTCFETFPLPASVADERVANAARKLNALRAAWLDPPEWTHEATTTFVASVNGPWAQMIARVGPDGLGSASYVRRMPNDEATERLWKKRTLTKLYSDRPQWLSDAHAELDLAVARLYGWADIPSDEAIVLRLLELNLAGVPLDEDDEDEGGDGELSQS